MINRSFPDFVMAARFFHSADIEELEDALTWDHLQGHRDRGFEFEERATPNVSSDATGGNVSSGGKLIFLPCNPTSASPQLDEKA